MKLESYLGEAAVCNFSDKKGGEAISAEDFRREGVRKGDIVLVRTSAELMGDLPHMTDEALDWLIDMEMKLLASGGNLFYGPNREDHLAAERRLLENGIAMVDALYGLDQIEKKRVFFIGMPVKMRRVTAAWTRAVALEEIDPDT
jgi:kynurenine formamidase